MSFRLAGLVVASFVAAAQVGVLAAPKTPASAVGLYRGDTEGGGGELRITGAAPRYHAHYIIGGDGCAGGIEGVATADARGNLILINNQCRITMTKTPTGWHTSESNCSFFHGDACSFDGDLARAAH